MKKLGLLKVGSILLCTLTGTFASDTAKWDSIQNLESFVQFLIDDKGSKINDIDKILDYLKANAPDRFNAICGPVKAGQNVKNNIREWEAPYNTTLSQQKISKINFKCMNTVVDTNLKPRKLELKPLEDKSKFAAPPVPKAEALLAALKAPPRAPSPKPVAPVPAAPAPQMSLDDMMDAEISGSWEESDSPSASKAPSRSNTPEPVVETPAQKAERERAEKLRLQGLEDVTTINIDSVEETIIFFVKQIQRLRHNIAAEKEPIISYINYINEPRFQGAYAGLSKQLEESVQLIDQYLARLDALSSPNDTMQTYDPKKPLGESIKLLGEFKEAVKRGLPAHLSSQIRYDVPGDTEKRILHNGLIYQAKNMHEIEDRITLILAPLNKVGGEYDKVLDESRASYEKEKSKYDAIMKNLD